MIWLWMKYTGMVFGGIVGACATIGGVVRLGFWIDDWIDDRFDDGWAELVKFAVVLLFISCILGLVIALCAQPQQLPAEKP